MKEEGEKQEERRKKGRGRAIEMESRREDIYIKEVR